MAQVNLDIGGRSFSVTCQDGEEDHLSKLAEMVSKKANEAGDPAGLTESRMLLFTSLLLADELHGIKNAPPEPKAAVESPLASPPTSAIDEKTLEALEKMADRVEAVANSLEQGALPS